MSSLESYRCTKDLKSVFKLLIDNNNSRDFLVSVEF